MPALDVFPDYTDSDGALLLPEIGWTWEDEANTTVLDGYKSGVVYVQPNREETLYRASFKYGNTSGNAPYVDDLRQIWSFFRAHRGRGVPFILFDIRGIDLTPVGRVWDDLLVGVGDGSRSTWDTPTKGATSHSATVGGVAETHYTLTVGGADDGSGGDKIVFASGHEPARGKLVRITATCRRKVPVTLDSDVMSFNAMVALLETSGIGFREFPMAA